MDYKATIAKLRDEKRKLKADLQAARAKKKAGGATREDVQKARARKDEAKNRVKTMRQAKKNDKLQRQNQRAYKKASR